MYKSKPNEQNNELEHGNSKKESYNSTFFKKECEQYSEKQSFKSAPIKFKPEENSGEPNYKNVSFKMEPEVETLASDVKKGGVKQILFTFCG